MAEPSEAARDAAKRIDFEPCDHVKTTNVRKLDCLDCTEDAIQRAIDSAVDAERERIRLRLGCIAEVSARHNLHSCPADDCMICWPTDLIDEFAKFAAQPQVQDEG